MKSLQELDIESVQHLKPKGIYKKFFDILVKCDVTNNDCLGSIGVAAVAEKFFILTQKKDTRLLTELWATIETLGIDAYQPMPENILIKFAHQLADRSPDFYILKNKFFFAQKENYSRFFIDLITETQLALLGQKEDDKKNIANYFINIHIKSIEKLFDCYVKFTLKIDPKSLSTNEVKNFFSYLKINLLYTVLYGLNEDRFRNAFTQHLLHIAILKQDDNFSIFRKYYTFLFKAIERAMGITEPRLSQTNKKEMEKMEQNFLNLYKAKTQPAITYWPLLGGAVAAGASLILGIPLWAGGLLLLTGGTYAAYSRTRQLKPSEAEQYAHLYTSTVYGRPLTVFRQNHPQDGFERGGIQYNSLVQFGIETRMKAYYKQEFQLKKVTIKIKKKEFDAYLPGEAQNMLTDSNLESYTGYKFMLQEFGIDINQLPAQQPEKPQENLHLLQRIKPEAPVITWLNGLIKSTDPGMKAFVSVSKATKYTYLPILSLKEQLKKTYHMEEALAQVYINKLRHALNRYCEGRYNICTPIKGSNVSRPITLDSSHISYEFMRELHIHGEGIHGEFRVAVTTLLADDKKTQLEIAAWPLLTGLHGKKDQKTFTSTNAALHISLPSPWEEENMMPAETNDDNQPLQI